MSLRKPELLRQKAIAPLPLLPVFHDLRGRKALAAGAGPGLDWKVELLTAAGAEVRRREAWSPGDFEGVALAIGSFTDEEEAARFARTSRATRTPVNVIDRPALCDFQFGAIVNRAPVVAAVSTAGASPALAQAVRTRIETMLPFELGRWASAASKARSRLAQLLPEAGRRREAWRRFAEAAFADPAGDPHAALSDAGSKLETKGHVTLVGAGPGAADLLTLRAVRAMQAADVILFDDLVSDEVLSLARREAKRMLVGKRGYRASCRQEDINALMVKLAHQGKRVVRLKSGDPSIFGRAGEEIAALEAAGVRVEMAPGVTAAFAAAAALGVSLTHRHSAQAVKFITAHSRHGALPDLDWRACADPATTLVVYMGGRMAGDFARRLVAEGLEPATPAVVLESISRPRERRLKTSLGGLCAAPVSAEGPVLIGIGPVFATAKESAKRLRAEAA